MAVSPERLGGDLSRLLHQGAGMREFAHSSTRLISRTVSFEGVCVVTLDPATLLPTAAVMENALPAAAMARWVELELEGTDINSLAALARGPHVAYLSAATGGDLDRSQRHREVRAPNGFGDELRALLSDEGGTWGALTLLRAAGSPYFTDRDVQIVAAMSGYLAEGLRRALLLPGGEGALQADAGVVLLAPDGTLLMADAAAETWLEELGESVEGDPVPHVVRSVASRARAIAAGTDTGIARARARTLNGHWLLVRGTMLGEQAAVILEPARPHELAPLFADAHGLTDRERAVTQLVAQGLQTNAISLRLSISPWTVQDHLKSVFEKVGVSSRGELVASLFFEHYAPRLTNHV